MTSLKQLSIDTIVELDNAVTLSRSYSMESRSWEAVNATVDLCASLMWLVRLPITTHPIDANNNHSATLRRFYNETVGFIMGERRTVDVIIWEGLVNDISNFHEQRNAHEGGVGSNGSLAANYHYFHRPQDHSSFLSSLTHDGTRDDLLSYAHRDILHTWMLRKNGLDDMLCSLTMLAKLYYVYEHSSLKRA